MRSCRRAASRSDLNGVQERLLPFFSSLGWCVHALGWLLLSLSLSPVCLPAPLSVCSAPLSGPAHSSAPPALGRLPGTRRLAGQAAAPRSALPRPLLPLPIHPGSSCHRTPSPPAFPCRPLPSPPSFRLARIPRRPPAATTPFPRLTLSGPLPPFHCLPLSLSLFQHSPTFHTLSPILHSLPPLPSSRISPYLHSVSPSFHSSHPSGSISASFPFLLPLALLLSFFITLPLFYTLLLTLHSLPL